MSGDKTTRQRFAGHRGKQGSGGHLAAVFSEILAGRVEMTGWREHWIWHKSANVSRDSGHNGSPQDALRQQARRCEMGKEDVRKRFGAGGASMRAKAFSGQDDGQRTDRIAFRWIEREMGNLNK